MAAFFWGVLATVSVIRFWLAKIRWSKEAMLLTNTGYYDPGNTSGAPPWPWVQWGVLVVAYAVMVAFAISRKRAQPPL